MPRKAAKKAAPRKAAPRKPVDWRAEADKLAAKKAAAKAARKRAPRKAAPKKPARRVVSPTTNLTPDEVLDAIERGAEHLQIEVLDPVYEAFKLARSGMEWSEVAHRTGYATRDGVQQAVTAWLVRAAAEMGPERRAIAMQLSISRHEALLHSWWERATLGGDHAAAAIVSRELTSLDKVQRLDQAEVEGVGTSRTIVISANPTEYAAQLRRIVEGGPPPIEA